MSPIETELRTHASALRALARNLVGEQHADDLLQDAAVQALQRPPRRPGSLAGWLFTVVRRLASKHWRGERRRRARERLAAKPEVVAPDFAFADREVFRRLNEAVLALPEPYQGTVLLRYLRLLPVTAIAQQTRVPLATVKTRLARGLALLRERLGRDGAGDWRAALATAFGLERALPVAAAATTGVMLMGTAIKLCGAGAAALLAVAAWLWLREAPPELVPVAGMPSDTPVAAAAPVDAAGDAVPAQQRREVTAPTLTTTALVTLHGRTVDTAGAPLAGCAVRVHARPGSIARLAAWQRDNGAFQWQAPAPVATGSDGVFTLLVAPSGPYIAEFAAAAKGRATAVARWPQFVSGADIDLGDIVLRRLVDVHLRAIDSRGDALAQTAITFHLAAEQPGPATSPEWLTVLTDGNGRAIAALAEGVHGVRSNLVNEYPTSLSVPGDRSSLDAELQFRGLRGAAFLSGVVTAAGGAPLANAVVRGGRTPQADGYSTRTDDAGRFVLGRPEGFPVDALYLRCDCDGFDASTTPEPVAWGTTDLQLVLQPGGAAILRVRTADGRAVEDYRALVWSQGHLLDAFDHGGRHPRGEIVFDPLPRGSLQLSVEPAEPALAGRYCQRFCVGDPLPAMFDVVLPAAASRTLRVVTAAGNAVAGARFELIDPHVQNRPDLQTTVIAFDEWPRVAGDNLALLLQRGTTDAQGEAVLRGASGQRFAIRLPGGACLPCLVQDVTLDDPAPLLLTVAPGACIRGRIGPALFVARMQQATGWQDPNHWPEAFAQPNLHVAANATDSALENRIVALDADGRYRLRGLQRGCWRLQLVAAMNGPGLGSQQHDLGSVELGDGDTVDRDFDLAALTPALVRGTVRIDGAAPANGQLSLGGLCAIGPGGSFELWAAPGSHRPTFSTDDWRGNGIRFPEQIEVAPGATLQCTLAVRTGLLRVRLVDQQDRPVMAEVSVQTADGDWRGQCEASADGRLARRLEAGTFVLRAWPRSLQSEAARDRFAAAHADDPGALLHQLVELGSITVAAGNEAWQTLVVPPAFDR